MLKPPVPGLRPLMLDSKSTAKVALNVAPGDVLAVSDDLAAQLQAADPHFVDHDEDKVAVFEQIAEDQAAAEAAQAAVISAGNPDGDAGVPVVTQSSTKKKLVAHAEARGIDLGDASTKAEIVAVIFPDEG